MSLLGNIAPTHAFDDGTLVSGGGVQYHCNLLGRGKWIISQSALNAELGLALLYLNREGGPELPAFIIDEHGGIHTIDYLAMVQRPQTSSRCGFGTEVRMWGDSPAIAHVSDLIELQEN